ncbi:MAG: DUF333 domain-containing protein [Candidatus Moraniibacteriota bacterium]
MKMAKNIKYIVCLIFFLMIFLISDVYAVLDPSAVYCEAMKYTFSILDSADGDTRVCTFSNGVSVGAVDFLKGKAGQEYSFCTKNGYALRHVVDGKKCSPISSADCSVCVVNGEEVEVTSLMGLTFLSSICGDSSCNPLEENYSSCSKDCSSGQEDYYCDKVADSLCDPDCFQGEDPDCSYVISGEQKCVYDGVCISECIGKGDIDCICLNPESEECKLALKCNNDGVCLGNENSRNCPNDCVAQKDDKSSQSTIGWPFSFAIKIFAVISFIAVFVIFIFLKIRKSRKEL